MWICFTEISSISLSDNRPNCTSAMAEGVGFEKRDEVAISCALWDMSNSGFLRQHDFAFRAYQKPIKLQPHNLPLSHKLCRRTAVLSYVRKHLNYPH